MSDRHQFRANWHGYNDGLYFVTVCTREMKPSLGAITDNEMHLSHLGAVLDYWLRKAPESYEDICMINYVIMPNHFHCLLDIRGEQLHSEQAHYGCLYSSHRLDKNTNFHHNSLLSRFIGNIKRAVTMEARKAAIDFTWQRSFHEHIVKHDSAYKAIMLYIDRNVSSWTEDRFYR